MGAWILSPPVAFSIILLAALLMSALAKRTSWRGPRGPGAEKPYSCGEDLEENSFRPEYSQFFAFAFFFTIMHVVALVLATAPGGARGHYLVVAIYAAIALTGLSLLMRKER